MALESSHAFRTSFGSLGVTSRAGGWSRTSTFLVTDDPAAAPCQAISRAAADRIGKLQDAHLGESDAIRLDGTVGMGDPCRLGTTLIVERDHAHVAAVWERLAGSPAEPAARIVCTPGLRVDGYPDGRVIAVDLDARVTRICGTDFPGEAKRASLRAWAMLAWQRGGLPLHAAVKMTAAGEPLVIAGRPQTGKTSIAFAPGATTPCQEDRVAWMPDGTLVLAEQAFFAPAAHPGPRPLVERALVDRDSVLLNVAQNGRAAGHFAPVGRVVFGAPELGPGLRPRALILLVRNQNVLPAVARLDARTAAAVYTATHAAHRASEATGGMRPTLGASPLFPVAAAAEGRRLLDLLDRRPTEVYVLNTWRVGGPVDRAGSRKINACESAALVDAIAAGRIDWAGQDDLGCTIAASVDGVDVPRDVLDPHAAYARQGRLDEYRELAARLRSQWDAALAAIEAQL